MRSNFEPGATGLQRAEPEHVFAEPRRGSARPAMTQAVAQSLITKIAVIDMQVFHALGHNLIDRVPRFPSRKGQSLPRTWWHRSPAWRPSIFE